MWQQLAGRVAMLIKNYQRLQALNEEKREVLVLVKIRELEDIVRREEEVLKDIQAVERERREIIASLQASGVILREDSKMAEVWSRCPDSVLREKLRKLHLILQALTKKVQEEADNNSILIASALDAINFRLNQLGGSTVEPAYGHKGEEVVSHQKNFDLEI